MCEGATGATLTVTFVTREEVPTVIPTGRIRSAQLPDYAVESVDFSDLDHVVTCKKPGDIVDLGETMIDVFFNAALAKPWPGQLATMTVTFPLTTDAGTVRATLVATGFFRSVQWPNAAINEPMMNPMAFVLDGHDDNGTPTFTLES